MKNKIFMLIATLSTIVASAQVQINGAIVHNNGATIFINGNTVNNGGTLNNLGVISVDGNLTNNSAASLITNQASTDTIYVSRNLNIVNGSYDGANQAGNGYQGAIVMNGTSAQTLNAKNTNSDNIYNLEINNSSATGVNINGSVICDNTIRFTDGNFITTLSDSLALATDVYILGAPSGASHVDGPFYREAYSATNDLFFPIGGVGSLYRPVTLEQVPPGVTRPIIGFEMVNGAVAGATPGMGVENLVNTRYWHGVIVDGDYQGAKLNLSHKAVEGALTQNRLVVAQSATSNGTYVSLDQSSVNGISTNGDVSSEFDAHDGYYMIGQSANMRVNLNVFLEGAYDTLLDVMNDDLNTYNTGTILTSHYENGNSAANGYGIEMLNKYPVPNGAVKPVDVVKVTIRDVAAPTVDIDETYAWLMTDGSIRDFGAGLKPFITFTDLSLTVGVDYALVVWHRNHLPMMYALSGETISQSTVAPQLFNMKNPVNIYSTGYKQLGGVSGNIGMYIGNAEQAFTPLEVNAFDLFVVGNDAVNNIRDDDLMNVDVDLSGAINSTDWIKTKWANDQLYYSTLP